MIETNWEPLPEGQQWTPLLGAIDAAIVSSMDYDRILEEGWLNVTSLEQYRLWRALNVQRAIQQQVIDTIISAGSAYARQAIIDDLNQRSLEP